MKSWTSYNLSEDELGGGYGTCKVDGANQLDWFQSAFEMMKKKKNLLYLQNKQIDSDSSPCGILSLNGSQAGNSNAGRHRFESSKGRPLSGPISLRSVRACSQDGASPDILPKFLERDNVLSHNESQKSRLSRRLSQQCSK